MNKEEIQDFVMQQLKILRIQQVKSLIKLKRIEELESVVGNLKFDFNPIIDYQGAIYEKREEIPKDYIFELICYVKLSDWKFFLYPEDIVNVIEEIGEWEMACLIITNDIQSYSWKQLMCA